MTTRSQHRPKLVIYFRRSW